ncbi:alkylation response protein AidB-like acyl-CoA dehydrogenase [Pseudonocardia hierapolitana]|uniref:Acyl-[acyl-carrier-protein] dehydrogenase MbtN n=1 Tax=Pseudonocardia hierapolitana TaxID=1128676 RepID=A0A561SXZ7_9PSEU|nr:acyl-CoA dehydrogenase family protein [Pseudonocardia hierapolitana]TWF79734.1 alkylation response protein AidB-like acyl-CoA dehydrogenase [Pseudonocardia hierapolitana]
MQRDIFDAEHDAFRDLARTFIAKEVTPFHEQWEHDGQVSRDVWLAAGRAGLLGIDVPDEFGGGGVSDFRYNAVLTEELSRAGASGVGFPLQNDVVAPYLLRLATDEQKQRWLPGFCSGEIITAIAMTEPGTGSDLQGIQTNARRDGDVWVLNGAKTFITNGIMADLVIVVARTDPDAGSRGFSLLVVERGMPGFERGRRLQKVGLKAQDTAELSFTDVRVPDANVLGEPGGGLIALMQNLAQERLSIAVGCAAGAARALEVTVEYTKERTAFGRPVSAFQNTRFELAEIATEVDVTQAFVDRCLTEHVAGRLDPADAAKAKWWASDVLKRVVDRCVQLHGGYGYMLEYPIAKAFVDSRVQAIFGGTNEIMKEIIGRQLLG